jgi:hypothetical protein
MQGNLLKDYQFQKKFGRFVFTFPYGLMFHWHCHDVAMMFPQCSHDIPMLFPVCSHVPTSFSKSFHSASWSFTQDVNVMERVSTLLSIVFGVNQCWLVIGL